MKKQLLIIVYKIDVQGSSKQQAEQIMAQLRDAYRLSEDIELKDDYIIREIWLPSYETDVKVIYPIPRYTTSPELNNLVTEITERIRENPDSMFKTQWDRIVREIKLIKINTSIE
jgi:hypothetical protein